MTTRLTDRPLLVVAALGVALSVAAVLWSPVRLHRVLPTAVLE